MSPTPTNVPPARLPEPRDFGIDSSISLSPNEDFYLVSYSPGDPPEVDPASWRLHIGGLVNHRLTLTLDEIKAMSAILEMRTLECIGNPAGGYRIGNAVWKGVSAAEVLKMAGVRPEAREVKMVAADGYDTAIPIDLALHPRSLLAYEMNGESLPVKHGFPLRCLWPGRYGQKQPKWLTHIELISGHHLGYWETQGWSNEAVIRPNSHVRQPLPFTTLLPQPYTISGLAFSNGSGIARIEISTDDGKVWHEAEMRQAPEPFSRYVWTEWSYRWERPEIGTHWLLARVTDGSGDRQVRNELRLLRSETFPSGTKNMHAVRVTVERS